MNHTLPPTVAESRESGRAWVWMLVLAGLLILLGLAAMAAPALGARAFVALLGWLLVAGGVLQIAGALLFRGFGGFGAEVFLGALGVVLGAALLVAPVTTGSLIALLIVLGLIVDALLEAYWAIRVRRPGWVWPALIAALSLVLGLAIVVTPSLLLPLLGFLVGVSLVVRGVILLLAAIAVRKLGR